jgi:hypothetical protein
VRGLYVLDEVENEIEEKQGVNSPLEPLSPGIHGKSQMKSIKIVE